MEQTPYLTQFLYLLVYSSSLVSAAAVIVLRRRLDTDADKPLKWLILSITSCSTILSVQVFLNAVGLLSRLNESNASRITIIINILLITCIAALVYAGVSISYSMRAAPYGRILLRITATLITVVLLSSAVLQILTLIVHSLPAAELLGMLMAGGTVLFSSGIIFSAIRLVIPLRLKKDPQSLPAVRVLLFCLFILPALFIISGNTIGTVLAPTGFIGLNILCLRILFFRFNHPGNTDGPIQEKEHAPDPENACRELGLSKRESEVALLLSQGRSYKEIASLLYISMSTTQTHVGRIYSKLGINNKTELSNLLNYREN